jgi:hypothetical protein
MTDLAHLIQDLLAEAHRAPADCAELMRRAAAELESLTGDTVLLRIRSDALSGLPGADAAVHSVPIAPPGDRFAGMGGKHRRPGVGEPRMADREARAAADQPLLPIALEEHVALIKSGAALDAFARKRAVQIVTHGHTSEKDLERSIAMLAHAAKTRLNAFTEIVPVGRMNLPPANRERCIRYVEIAGGLLIALWERCQVELPE